jgi:nitrite reductase (NADH) small subunit
LSKSDLVDSQMRIVEASPLLKLAVIRVGDRVAAINNRCPHRGGSFGAGTFDGTRIFCPLHHFSVDPWTGIGTAGKPVQKFPVVVNGDSISITVPDPK